MSKRLRSPACDLTTLSSASMAVLTPSRAAVSTPLFRAARRKDRIPAERGR